MVTPLENRSTAMIVRQHPGLGPNYARSSLRLSTRLTHARSGKLASQWTVPRHRGAHRGHVQKHRVCCKRSDPTDEIGLINVSVQVPVEAGDSLESLSAKHNISESKLRKANGGQSEVTPGTELLVFQKVPENLMPTRQNKLVPIESAYSDDEGEMALVKENKHIRDDEQAQFVGVQAQDEARLQEVVGTARYVGGVVLKVGLVLFGVSALWKLMHQDVKSRLEDPRVRAEMAKRHGQSFLDHLDSENAEAEAEEIYEAQNAARKAAEQHLRRQQTPAAAFTPRRPLAASGAAAASGSPSKSELTQQQQQQQQQEQAPIPALHKQQHQQEQQQPQQQQQQEPLSALHKQQQEQEPVQALHQLDSQQAPMHSSAMAPSPSHAASHNSDTSTHAPAGLKSGLYDPSDSPSNVLHTPSSTAVAAAKGVSAAASTEADKAAGRPQGKTSSLPSSMSHESTASHQVSGDPSMAATAPRQSRSTSANESSVPASTSAALTSDSLAASPSDTASIAIHPEATEAAANGDRAVPADGPAADYANDPAIDPVADDPVARECPWVDSDLLYFVTNDEGYPFNTIIPADEQAGIEQQQCFLAYAAESDMSAVMYKTAALLPEDLVPAGQQPLLLLDACIAEDRPLAVVREGAAGGTEQVTDAKEWLQQLAASAHVLFPDQMQQILLARLDKIQELEAQFAAEADIDSEGEAEANSEAGAEADIESDAAAGVHADAAPHTSHVGSAESHASGMSAGASTSRQQGGKPHGEREDAYAAMKKKQVVQLSKDSLNQFNQVSIQAPDSTSASQPQLQPRPSAVGGSSQNGSHRRGAVSNNGDTWRNLSHICVPFIEYRDGDVGYITADMAEGNAVEQHILAFQARSDAEAVRYLVQAHLNELEAKVNVAPMASGQLQTRASELECHVTVYPPGQLQLKPGMTFEQFRQAAVAAR